jgi:PASTA domain-containing protein
MSKDEAEDELAGADLVARIEYDPSAASPSGTVIRATPAPGNSVPRTSIVDLVIAGDRGKPEVEIGIDAGLSPMGELVDLYPEAFVGLDVLAEPPVFVFNPGVDETSWKDELEWAARGRKYRTMSCPVSLLELRRVQAGLGLHNWWTDRDFGYGLYVNAGTCQVRLMTDPLIPSESHALKDAYGDLVWIDESGGVERLDKKPSA